jgi:hypothetical protein
MKNRIKSMMPNGITGLEMVNIRVNTEECDYLNTSLNVVILIKSRRIGFIINAARRGRRKFSTKF